MGTTTPATTTTGTSTPAAAGPDYGAILTQVLAFLSSGSTTNVKPN